MKRRRFLAVLIGALLATSASAEKHRAAAAATTEGQVRKVDKASKRITIQHGPIENLEMPAMTMVFQVQDHALLDQLKAGDKVKFRAEKIGGAFTVTKIEQAE